jgi:hypothetical protein
VKVICPTAQASRLRHVGTTGKMDCPHHLTQAGKIRIIFADEILDRIVALLLAMTVTAPDLRDGGSAW